MNTGQDEREEGMISDDDDECGGSKELRNKDACSPPSGYHSTKAPKDIQSRSSHGGTKDNNRHGDTLKPTSGDEEVEEGQIPGSPLRGSSKLVSYKGNSPSRSRSRSLSKTSSRSASHSRSSSRSRSKSLSAPRGRRKRNTSRSRSRSKSRKRRSFSRSRSRSHSRSRSRSSSRSPYSGPIIKDYRRGRRGNFPPFNRFPRGRRPFRRGAFVPHHGFRNKYRDYSRSPSKSLSPKRGYQERCFEKDARSPVLDEEDKSEVLNPADIKKSQKQITQSFLAMLEEKQKKSKMVPIEYSKHEKQEMQRQHGFVNTFATVGTPDSQSKLLSYELEKDGWQVIDDAETDSVRNKIEDMDEDTKERHYEQRSDEEARHGERRSRKDKSERENVAGEKDASESEEENMEANESDEVRLKSCVRRKRKRSTSASSQNEDETEKHSHRDKENKKRSKKKKKDKKKRKRTNPSSSTSEDASKERKKKSKKKKKSSKKYSESESDEEEDETVAHEDDSEKALNNMNPEDSDGSEKKVKHKRKKAKRARSSSSDDESEEKSRKKKSNKKKSKKKRSKKKKRESSSSSSSENSESSDSEERRKSRKKKKKRKSKKSKKSKKDSLSKESKKKSTKKKTKSPRKSKDVQTIQVDPFPNTIITYTATKPCLQYSINPLYVEDFKQTFKPNRNDGNSTNQPAALVSEYEKFLNEVNPNHPNDAYSLENHLREKLLQQMHEKTEVTESKSKSRYSDENTNNDYLSPSEKRALERIKKQQQKELEKEEEVRRQEDLKSAPLSAYYSTKKLPMDTSNDLENTNALVESSNSTAKLLKAEKGEEISISFGDGRSKKEANDKRETEEEKKPTAKELLDRIKQKKKDGEAPGADQLKPLRKFDKLPVIGKLKKPTKKSALSGTTGANATAEQIAVAMNSDYNWYVQYYMTTYGLDAYSAAYYAQYVMLTSGEYQYTDTAMWMQQQGYSIPTESMVTLDSTALPTTSTSLSLESQRTTDLGLEPHTAQQTTTTTTTTAAVVLEDALQSGNKSPLEKSIEVVVPRTPLSATEVLLNDNSINLEPRTSEEIRTTKFHEDCMNVESPSSPPPPPPFKRPQITSFISANPVTLPNGQKLPAGTCQIVVHPYPASHPLCESFTSDAYEAACNAAKNNSFNIYSKPETADAVR